MNRSITTCPVYIDGESFCAVANADFVRATAADVVNEIAHLEGAAMMVSGYTLAGSQGPRTFLVLTLYVSTENSSIIGISFGGGSESDVAGRAGFNAVAWRKDPCHPLTAGIRAANWDEAWKLVCTIGHQLNATDIQLRYGG